MSSLKLQENFRRTMLLPEQFEVVSNGRAWGDAVERLRPLIDSAARTIADGDEAFAEDLKQEALIGIWEWDPTRFDSPDSSYLKKAVIRRMLWKARRERRVRDRQVSLSRFEGDREHPEDSYD